ncbi:CBL-interacting serine/threonine-protein kinase 25 [Colletotrichum shisoi]|uniref:CBL-interacting serine/threonine-protein kinase 25 n=1 Tax=Colletotrichum shisoi TaxID=2078593 RepID=A0A5Q4BN23_9PEZI|nr:CBL-interacting serine/threonine-protein kinase 25 [Colletotrichum shisoi]
MPVPDNFEEEHAPLIYHERLPLSPKDAAAAGYVCEHAGCAFNSKTEFSDGHHPEFGTVAVFKYYFLWQYAQMSWKEMNLWMRLPRHPNIVPFDRVVVDEIKGCVVGFTSSYVPGGNLEENRSRVFRLKWLRQLIDVVDDLNLEHGIAHQDIAPRNLLVDESTDYVMLFDVNFAARINHPSSPGEGESYLEDRNDIKGVIFTAYEIITQDNSLRSMPHEDQNLDSLGGEWVKHSEVKLDHPVAAYKLMLQEWQERRASDLRPVNPRDVPRAIDWPSRPKPPQETISLKNTQGQLSQITFEKWYERRQDVLDRGDKILNWERLPQRLLDNGTRVLSSGEVINS